MQTIKMTNKDALEMLMLIERTLLKIEGEDKTDTLYYDQVKSIEKAIHLSCPELVDRWLGLQEMIKSVKGEHVDKLVADACDRFDEWINLNE